MEYCLHARVLDTNPRIPITEMEYLNYRQSGTILAAAFAIEEIYDLLLANYRELEASALEAAVKEMTSRNDGYEASFETRSELNRRTMNLLNAARLYLDQFRQWMKEAGGEPSIAIKRSNEIYDSCFEYRFMEALRNHVQHAGRAVHGIQVRSSWIRQEEPWRLQFAVQPYASRSALQTDGGFKKAVLAECPELVAILPAARSYVSGISAIHELARSLIETNINSARQLFRDAINSHAAAAGCRLAGLAALAEEDNRVIDETAIFLDWDDVRITLSSRNPIIQNLDKRFITSNCTAC